jgi:hypothetical protein
MADQKHNGMANKEEDEFYGGMAELADFIHDHAGVEGPMGFNNSVDEYMEPPEEQAADKGKS